MTSALINSAARGLLVGSIGYVISQRSNQSNPFEKAVLVTVLVGLRTLAESAITHQLNDKTQTRSLTRVLIVANFLLAIPCALYAGRVFNFKSVDYLTIVGLASMGSTITSCLASLCTLLSSKGSK
jgi:hypothetical protein